MIDPNLFTVESLLKALMDDMFGNVNAWRKHATIIPFYMPPKPSAKTVRKCVVQYENCFLRYSMGPKQGYFWDMYGDDFQTPALALLALCAAPVPPCALRGRDV